ncbi:MAG: hypothetical protein ABFS32_23330, partial [Bacteroidota bacterium]
IFLLAIFRPKLEKQRLFRLPHWLEPMPNIQTLGIVFVLGFSAVAVSLPVLILNEPKTVTSTYEVLEPETWIGKELPILEHIDIGEQLKTGNWLVMLYHHDCLGCTEAIPKIEQMARDLESSEGLLQFALIEVPPYGPPDAGPVSANTLCDVGRLNLSKEWFVTTPALSLIQKSYVLQSWENAIPELEELINIRIQAINNVGLKREFAIK